jgi:23S rRNA (uracil1939-C5)-methyltransferase
LLLTIEKLIYGGDGLARLPADEKGRGKAVFVPFVLAGEKVEASLGEQKPGFVRATAEAIVEPSPHRVAPGCPYFGQCGGCHYQHATYEHQLEIKKEILRESLSRTAKLDLTCEIQAHASPPWNYRNRSRLQVQTRPEFAAGYFRMASHELLAVEQCPISSPLINRAIAALWRSGRAGKVPQGIREVEFFANADDAQLLVEISCAAEARRAAVRAWAEELRAEKPEIGGVVAFREAEEGSTKNPTQRKPPFDFAQGRLRVAHAVSQERFLTIGAGFLTYQTQHAAYRVSAGSFFQTNRYLTDELVKIVTEGQSGQLAFDLYAGVGLFSTALAGDFHHIVSVESSQTSSADLSYNRPANGDAVQATTEQYLTREYSASAENSGRVGKGGGVLRISDKPDLAVVDPPRSGLGERVARMLATLGAPRVVYVSCDPATLARDLVHLLGSGYRVEQVHIVDLFPQTYHIESVVQMVR